MARRPTQKDVARVAGLSQATVSMVLSGTAGDTPTETLSRINNAIRELDYVPNRFAQALKTSKTMTIACIVPDISNPFYPSLMRGIQSVADGLRYDVIAVNTDGLAERERHFLDWSRQGRVDGVIGVFWTLRAPDFAVLIGDGVPVVRFENTRKEGGDFAIDNIFVDSRRAAYEMTRYLLGKGHHTIAMIAGRGGTQAVRVDGYLAAMHEAGAVPNVVIDDDFNETGGGRAALAILDHPARSSAIFAANDLMAIGAMQAVRERGLSIPQDIAIAGFDDISSARLVWPGLTTVAQFQYQMGVRAAEILMERLKGQGLPTGVAHEMPFSIIERGSA
ncbi:LacI family DNA-binding transcriptional regulator [uncultured Devosia sp.]|uniref:LacI family DNA-binding transcriptional regulator n=1 Tax=uncultured Devosia sp. TaxID=211434 RepID=UPI0035CC0A3D